MECLIANTPETREQVFRLRYTCYRRKGSIEAREDQQFSDEFDRLPNSFSFLVRSSSEALASIRISVVRPDRGWTDAPVRHVYGDHPAFRALEARSFVEASRLCFHRQARRDSFVKLLGNMAALAEMYETEWLVACPRVEHARAYRKMFGFKALAEPRQYFAVAFQTQLLGIRLREIRAYISDAKPMRNAWAGALASLVQSPALPVLRAGCVGG